MPQMSPMNWIFISYISLLLMNLSKIYFNMTFNKKTPSKLLASEKKMKMSW